MLPNMKTWLWSQNSCGVRREKTSINCPHTHTCTITHVYVHIEAHMHTKYNFQKFKFSKLSHNRRCSILICTTMFKTIKKNKSRYASWQKVNHSHSKHCLMYWWFLFRHPNDKIYEQPLPEQSLWVRDVSSRWVTTLALSGR